ncbi:family 1 glycosylhydrolase [Micromonospora inaquosa]|uniref:family 1 glycosylhydrolase n=1 Tax=Micromonospora inaquosa TaxID=2203716 RepID=UPI001FC91859|nr:family 1 glycosylhydrolase [Micromonospora inaquosa]
MSHRPHDDTERIRYLTTHLAALAQARAKGVDVRGYLHWSVDDSFTRLPKPSAHVFARIARASSRP